MSSLRRITKVSFFALLLSIMKVSCYIGTSAKGTSSILQSDVSVEQNDGSKLNVGVNNFNELAERFSDHFVTNIVSALQTDAASFIQSKSESQFNFKEVAKEQAKGLLKEILKTSLEPVEQTVAESVSPPTLSSDASKFAKLALKELFNKAEKFAGVDIPDSIWDSTNDESEENEETDEDSENGEEEEDLNEEDFEYEDEE